MALPPLSAFSLQTPTSLAAAPPSRWLEAGLMAESHQVVLVNGQNKPIRVVLLQHLLRAPDSIDDGAIFAERLAARDRAATLSAIATLPEQDLQIIEHSTPTSEAARRIAAQPQACWVIVDADQQYQGQIDTCRLLAAAYDEITRERQTVTPATATETPPHLTTKSSTALLTYLGHELKTPLTSLLGLASLLKLTDPDHRDSRQHRYITLIQQHCRRLAAWVNTLIDLGRIESGTLRLIPQMVDVGEVWPAAYQQAAAQAGIAPQEPIPQPAALNLAAAPVTLVADPVRLQQMLSCLMQPALLGAAHPHSAPSSASAPLDIAVWNDWVSFRVDQPDEHLSLNQIAQTIYTLPFAESAIAASPISAEMSHWLEWLLVRKLAQRHQGELALVVCQNATICPTLVLPTTPAAATVKTSRFILVVAPLTIDSLKTLWQQAEQLDYRLLIAPQVKDAIEIASHLPVVAVLMLIQSTQAQPQLHALKAALAETATLLIALVAPACSSLLGNLPADRELLWPSDKLGSVLLHPTPSMPPPSRLTVLYLRSAEHAPTSHAKFPHIFHEFGCRVLEVDDLEQASLLRRVWHPDVAILDPAIASPRDYLKDLTRFTDLTSLPLITLTMATTQAAHAFPAISVFPCLVEESSWRTPEAEERLTTWLIQVLQVAAVEQAQS